MNTIYVSWQMYKESKYAHRNIKETFEANDITATVEYLCEFNGKKWAKVTTETAKDEIISILAVNRARELEAPDDEMLRNYINAIYNEKRDLEMQSPFMWGEHKFDGDDKSFTLINSAIDLGIEQDWTLYDNSILHVTIADLEEIKLARITTGSLIFQNYRNLKTALKVMTRDELISTVRALQMEV